MIRSEEAGGRQHRYTAGCVCWCDKLPRVERRRWLMKRSLLAGCKPGHVQSSRNCSLAGGMMMMGNGAWRDV